MDTQGRTRNMTHSDEAGCQPTTALRGAAGLAGAAWLAPVVTVVSMDSASAASAPPPSNGGGTSGGGGTADPGGTTGVRRHGFVGAGVHRQQHGRRGRGRRGHGGRRGGGHHVAARLRRSHAGGTEPEAVPPAGRHRTEAGPRLAASGARAFVGGRWGRAGPAPTDVCRVVTTRHTCVRGRRRRVTRACRPPRLEWAETPPALAVGRLCL